jgi:hypothetical protein
MTVRTARHLPSRRSAVEDVIDVEPIVLHKGIAS